MYLELRSKIGRKFMRYKLYAHTSGTMSKLYHPNHSKGWKREYNSLSEAKAVIDQSYRHHADIMIVRY